MLAEILRAKRREIDESFSGVSIDNMIGSITELPPVRDFRAALTQPGLGLIAEIKPASPSRGVLAADVDPAHLAAVYEAAGADAVSVLTDREYFGGDIANLKAAGGSCSLPILRKDFILDERQVYQSRLAGADAILLIAAVLDDPTLARLIDAARLAGLHILAEAHDEDEVARLIAHTCDIIGANNRDLKDFTVDLAVTERLAPAAAAGAIYVSASGIQNGSDAARVARTGADAVLVGEALMRAGDVSRAVQNIKRAG